MKRLFVAITLLLSINENTVFACGGGYGSTGNFGNFFGPNLLSDQSFAPYFISSPNCAFCNEDLIDANLLEWKTKFPQIEDLNEINELVNASTEEQIDKLNSGINTFNGNKLAELLLNPAYGDYKIYLLFAKQAERESFLIAQEQKEEAQSYQAAIKIRIDLAQKALDLYKDSKDEFLKQRYLFQAVKLTFYAESFEECIKLVDANIAKVTKNALYYRTLAYKAGALKNINRKAEGDFLFAQIFASSQEARGLAFTNFLQFSDQDKDWAGIYALANNPQEKANLWALRNLYINVVTQEGLNEVYQNDPLSDKLEILTLKYLNDIESSLYIPYLEQSAPLDSTSLTYGAESTWDVHGEVKEKSLSWWQKFWNAIVNFFRRLFGMKPVSKLEQTKEYLLAQNSLSDSYIKPTTESNTVLDFKNFLKKVLEEKKTKNNALYLAAYAYTLIMTEDYKAAKEIVQQGLAENPTAAIKTQLSQLDVLNETLYGSIDENYHKKLLSVLQSYKTNEDEFGNYRKNLILTELSRRCIESNNHSLAVLSLLNTSNSHLAAAIIDWYFTIAEYDNFVNEVTNSKDEIMVYLAKAMPSSNELKEIKAVKLVRLGNFEEAQKLFEALNSAGFYNENTSEDNNYENYCKEINTTFKFDAWNKEVEFSNFNKAEFNKELLENINNENYYQAANGLYYSQYYNYNVALWHCGDLLSALNHTSYPGSYPFNKAIFATKFHNRKMAFVKQYCTQFLSFKYYEKALAKETIKEQKARLLYLSKLANEKSYVSYTEYQVLDDNTSKFEELKNTYKDTQFYQEAATKCAYLKLFLNNAIN